jgi:thiamine pyrophosphate-dependent acetolactate synthase large subunit-like protein
MKPDIRITIVACKNYKTEVRVNEKLIYSIGLHSKVVVDDLVKLFNALGANGITIEEAKEI